MVDPIVLATDIAGSVVALALPAMLWAFLFLLAWENRPFAESLGFGRRAFWLLLPGALAATFALLPFAAVANDLVAVSFGGAVFPVFVGALALRRVAPPVGRTVGRFLAVLAVARALLLVLVLPVAAPFVSVLADRLALAPSTVTALLLLLVAALFPTIAALRARVTSWLPANDDAGAMVARSDRTIAALLGLCSGVLYVTYLAAHAEVGQGIVEPFPAFLVPPIAAGAIAVLVARRAFPGAEAFALPGAYLATTFGVLVGADLLWQPPLYGHGPAGLYTIGGASVFDLVYLSGPLALAAAYACHAALGRSRAPVGAPLPAADPSPVGRIGEAFRAGVAGELGPSLAASARAGHEAADQARRLLELGPAPTDRPWQGLPVPGWIVADQANLDAVARAGSSDGREGFRGWLTARWLVAIGRDLGQRRFGTVRSRTFAFGLDLAVVTAPALLVWFLLAVAEPGGLEALFSSVVFNAAIYGFIALAFLYLVVAETVTGTSPGKRFVGLVVRDRALRPPGFLSVLVRNVSVLPVLTVVGLGGAIAVAVASKTGSAPSAPVAAIPLPGGLLAVVGVLLFLLGGVALLGAIAVLVIALTAERQRLGDVLAGTWVVRAPKVTAAAPPAAAAEPPPGPDPSG